MTQTMMMIMTYGAHGAQVGSADKRNISISVAGGACATPSRSWCGTGRESVIRPRQWPGCNPRNGKSLRSLGRRNPAASHARLMTKHLTAGLPAELSIQVGCGEQGVPRLVDVGGKHRAHLSTVSCDGEEPCQLGQHVVLSSRNEITNTS
jgi:hypothetical protein